MSKAIRNEYADLGVENYYRHYGHAYENPHTAYIKTLLVQNQHRIDYRRVLDLAAGGGEVSLILRGLGFEETIGCDPFTKQLYEQNTQKPCLPFSFADIIKGKLPPFPPLSEDSNEAFSSIICSFAMHLCPEKQLFALTTQIFSMTQNIIIITPHKRPALENFSLAHLAFTDFALTERGKKVFLKSYLRANF
jgi:SAM-dependent methyltransferase